MRAIYIATIAVIALTGCSTEPAVESDSPVSDLLFSSPAFSENQHAELQNRVTECMKSEGFDYKPEPFEEASLPADTEDTRSLDYRRTWGLVGGSGVGVWIDEGDLDQLVESANSDSFTALDSSGRKAWSDAEQRCYSQDDVDFSEALPVDISSEILTEAASVIFGTHPDLFDELDAWASCMSREGFDFTTPEAMTAAAYELYVERDEAGPHPLDVKIGIADYKCSIESLWPAQDEIISRLDTAVVNDRAD